MDNLELNESEVESSGYRPSRLELGSAHTGIHCVGVRSVLPVDGVCSLLFVTLPNLVGRKSAT